MSPILKVLRVEDDPEVLLGTKQHAHGGTLFLDEIESMPPAMQVKLLLVLQERKIERLGSNDPVTVDFRVIAASKPNLVELVEKGQFRQDLFYRLNVAVIDLPPLRERKEDIPQQGRAAETYRRWRELRGIEREKGTQGARGV